MPDSVIDPQRIHQIRERAESILLTLDAVNFILPPMKGPSFNEDAGQLIQDLLALVDAQQQQIQQLQTERDAALANNRRSICIFCGTITPFDPDANDEQRVMAMWTHAEHCDKRPEKRLAARIDELDAQISTLRETLQRMEWDGSCEHVTGCCAFCFQFPAEGHEAGCVMAKAIEALGGSATPLAPPQEER